MKDKESAIPDRIPISGSSLVYWYEQEDNRRILHISGKGDMPNFGTWENASPWYGFQEVVVDCGVTSLGKYGFYKSMELERIELPSSLRYVGKHCFEGCTKLESIIWPSTVSEVKSSTFKGCIALKSVVLSEGVNIIWRWAFQDCKMLQYVRIPLSIIRISTTAFSGVDLNCLELSACHYDVEDGCLYKGDMLVTASNKTDIIRIRSGTRVISDYSFYQNETIEEVYCPKTIMDIQKKAFAHCTNLKHVYCENIEVHIGENAFEDCPASLLSDANVSYQLTMNTGRIAATRNGYALLRDGRVSFTKGCVDGDISPLIQYNDFVDIQAGFDFVIGLRENGVVVATIKQTKKRDNYSFTLADIGDKCFPNNVHFPMDMKQIAAVEGRVAGIDRYGNLFHSQAHTFEQPAIELLPDKAKSVSVGYDTVLFIDQNNILKLLPENNGWGQDLKKNLCRRIKARDEIPVQCKIYNPYYCSPTIAALTDRNHLMWCSDINNEAMEFPVSVMRFAIGNGVVAAIDNDGKVFAQFRGGHFVEIPCTSKAVDVGVIHHEKLIVLYENGKDEILALDELLKE